jgi:DNA (cytosine-5)-methyltransferase 1
VKFSEFRQKNSSALSRLDPEELANLTHDLQWLTVGGGSSGKPPFPIPQGWELPATVEWNVPIPPTKNPTFRFIDLFAGIGGIRTALQNLGGACVFSSEWNEYAQKTYFENFGEFPFGDITKFPEKAVPDHDFLTAGFPCQAFSIAGKRRGFEETRGTLFFDVARIIEEKRPRVFLLENVKGLLNHDRGRTISVILDILRNDLKYYVPEPQIVNAKYFGVPQNRERIIIVGFAPELGIDDFAYPEGAAPSKTFKDIREKKAVSPKYYLSTRYYETLQEHKARHAAAGHGFGYQIIPDDGISGAIVVGGMGRERNLVVDKRQKDLTPVTNIKGTVNTEGIRRMTPREWARLQGFPEEFEIVVSDAQAYKQFGNSVAVPAIQAVADSVLKRFRLENR